MELTNEVVIVEDDEVVFENLVYFLNTKSFKRQTSNVWNYFTKIGKDREGFQKAKCNYCGLDYKLIFNKVE